MRVPPPPPPPPKPNPSALRWTKELRAQLLARKRAGEKQKDMAAEFGVSPWRIGQVIARARRDETAQKLREDDTLRELAALENRLIVGEILEALIYEEYVPVPAAVAALALADEAAERAK